MRTMREAARLLSFALTAVVLAAPVSTAWHELTVAHVQCAEHGELTHVAASHGSSLVGVRALDAVEAETPGSGTTEAHDHCAQGCTARSGTCSPVTRTAVRYEPPAAVSRTKPVRAESPGRAFVLASAPKTSPPSA